MQFCVYFEQITCISFGKAFIDNFRPRLHHQVEQGRGERKGNMLNDIFHIRTNEHRTGIQVDLRKSDRAIIKMIDKSV